MAMGRTLWWTDMGRTRSHTTLSLSSGNVCVCVRVCARADPRFSSPSLLSFSDGGCAVRPCQYGWSRRCDHTTQPEKARGRVNLCVCGLHVRYEPA